MNRRTTRIIGLHKLTDDTLACRNRGSDGRPRTLTLPGVPDPVRHFISPGAHKRHALDIMNEAREDPRDAQAIRTNQLRKHIAKLLVETHGRPQEDANLIAGQADRILVGGALKLGDKHGSDEKADVSVYIRVGGAEHYIDNVVQNADDLLAAARESKTSDKNPKDPLGTRIWDQVLDPGRCAELAVAGRMIANRGQHNLESSLTGGKPIGVTAASAARVPWTAKGSKIDDLFPDMEVDQPSAAAMGFDQHTAYLMANVVYYTSMAIDPDCIIRNLKGDIDAARDICRSWTAAVVQALAGGGQTVSGPPPKPYLVIGDVEKTGTPVGCLYSSCYHDPVIGEDVLGQAAKQLIRRHSAAVGTYSEPGRLTRYLTTHPELALPDEPDPNLATFVDEIVDASFRGTP